MKYLISIALGLLVSVNVSVATERVCTARIVNFVNYSSHTRYAVDCGSEKFDTPRIITSFLLPIPYNWKAAARKRLDQTMRAKNLRQVAKIKAAELRSEMLEKNLLIFSSDAKDTGRLFCLVVRSGEKSIGLGKSNKVSDLSFECSAPSSFQSYYSGLSNDEIEKILSQGGLVKTNVPNLYRKL